MSMRGADQIEDIYPLSPLQRGMLFHTLSDPAAAVYVSQLAVAVPGEPDDLTGRWQRLVDRHPALRTAFLWEGLEEPVQVVYRDATLPVTQHDWRGLPPAQQRERLTAFLSQDRATGFTPDRAPLARLAVLRTADRTQYLVWTHHGLLLDGWSSAILLDELVRGEPAEPAPPYRDFIEWLGGRETTVDAAYWRTVLGDVSEPTPLPAVDDGAVATGTGAQVTVSLDESQTAAVRQALRDGGLPLVVLAEAAWGLTLARLSRRDEAVFGLVTSGRTADLPGIERIVGLLTNTLPVGVPARTAEPVHVWLSRLLDAHGEAMRREHDPLYEVRRFSAVKTGRPLFETVLAVQNFPTGPAGGDDDVEGFESTNYPLTVTVLPGERLGLRLGYDTGVVSRPTAELVADCLSRALIELAARPDRPVTAVPVLPPERLPSRAHGPVREFPGETLIDLLQAAAAAHPDAPAIVAPDRVTYRDLHERAARLAASLTAAGVRSEDRIGIVLPRGVESVVATLAVLRCGAVYVPVDPGYPPARMEYLLRDSGCRLVLSATEYADRAALGGDVWCLDTALPEAAAAPVAIRPAHPDSVAYVIYTSGSTGRPKGVMVSHRAVLNTFRSLAGSLGLRAGDVVAHKVPVGFTDAVFEVLWPLCHGGAVAILDDATARDPEAMLTAYAAHDVAFSQLLPRQIEAFHVAARRLGRSDPLPRLKWVVNAGEPVPAEFVVAWDETFPSGRVANIYGMTESAIFATEALMDRGRAAELGRVPIGHPIANVRGYVLNHELERCPDDLVGELFLAGVGFARGYLERPGLTAERFVPDPFGPQGSRMYRTGDLARWLVGAGLDMVGRVDHQLKIRGMRVEPGEVEANLRNHPAVRDAAVALHDGRLIAYLVPGVPEPPSAAQVRDWMCERLPDHLVPSLLDWHEALPLTAHGKLDRAALPPPSWPAEPGSLADDPVERTVAGVWSAVLGRPVAGRHDDFFDIGGDSLLAVRLVGRLREIVPVPYTVGHLLAGPTVATCVRDLTELLADMPELSALLEDVAGTTAGGPVAEKVVGGG